MEENLELLEGRIVGRRIEGDANVYPQNLEETLHLFGEKGTVKLGGKSMNHIDVWEFSNRDKVDLGKKGLKETVENIYGNGHTSLFADVARDIRGDLKPCVDAHAGRRAVEMVLAIYKSRKMVKPVELPMEEFASADMVGEFS